MTFTNLSRIESILERCVFWSLAMLGFIVFSCLFPTGFASAFSFFSFIFGLASISVKILNKSNLKCGLLELSGVILFLYLTFSIIWSDNNLYSSLIYLSEYRIFFMLPIIVLGIGSYSKWRNLLWVCMAGAFTAMVASYGLAFDLIHSEDSSRRSLADSIFHGFVMSTFLINSLLLMRCAQSIHSRLLLLFLSLLILTNVLYIENGRTGYLQSLFVFLYLLIFTSELHWKKVFFMILGLTLVSPLFLQGSFLAVIELTLENIIKAIRGNFDSSVGYRLNFYIVGIDIWLKEWIFGHGVGDVASSLETAFHRGLLVWPTDNVHSEFINMLMIGGVVAFGLYSWFIHMVFSLGIPLIDRMSNFRFFMRSFAGVIIISSLFNSTIKDFGEKHLILIVLCGAILYLRSLQKSSRRSSR